jgi:hypothetical protein
MNNCNITIVSEIFSQNEPMHLVMIGSAGDVLLIGKL